MSTRRGAPLDGTRAVTLLEEAFTGPAWHGPCTRAVLRGVPAEMARWRPAPGRNTIWELVLHLAYTKRRVLSRLTGNSVRFPRRLRRPWWPELPEPADDRAWRRDLGLLRQTHRELVQAVAGASARALARVSRRPLADHVAGVALHDTYHGGQIGLLKKLYEGRPPAGRS